MSDKAVEYTGEGSPLFGLALRTSLLTFLTLGIYRFWQKTRIRRYVWSSVSVGGDRLEYTGTGLEKFLGFLVAVVILAVYLGIVQLLLFFFGLHFIMDAESEAEELRNMLVFYLSFLAAMPLFLYAAYRARRYKLARTRLRGIRFGMTPEAGGYVWRALGHGFLSMITLGILWPRQTFYLEKYMTDRSYYGDARFTQGGRWTALYRGLTHVLIGVVLMIVGGAAAAWLRSEGVAIAFFVVGYLWLAIGSVHYQVFSFRYLSNYKDLGGVVQFRSEARTGQVIGIVLLGGLAVGVVALVLLGALGAAFSQIVVNAMQASTSPSVAALIALSICYLVALAILWALQLVMIVQPMIRHYVETATVLNVEGLDMIRQRSADKGADAEGFADALDLGGAL